MENIRIDQDISVFYIAALSFPEGIMETHEKLHARVPFSAGRRYFGISRPEDGTIRYKAAAEELKPGEAVNFNCETLILKKGKYISLMVKNYREDLQSIDRAFKKLLSVPGLDPQGYCVEWYLNDQDVQCMIRLQD